MPRFSGVITALVTPFRDGAVDETAFAALIERQVAAGVHGLVPVGTTGETATLSHEEHARVVSLCVEVVAGRIPVIAGAGSNATPEAIDLVKHAKAAGADGALVVTPYYNRPSQEGLYQHYAAIARACDLPILVYNVPSRTAGDIANDTLARLAELPSIVGVKDATGDMSRANLQRLACGQDWTMLTGDDPSGLGYMAHGGHGCISVTANVAPAACARMYDAAMAGDFVTARAINDTLANLHRALFLDASPAPTKYALERLGLISGEIRLPIVPCAEAVRAEIDAAVAEAGVTA
jgi:4-hydroxy-tetrahydrodipicolinate synthase